MEVGLRVVRGPDWKWQNQDGGEGHVGTVIEVGRSANSNTPDKTVVVQWDSGFRTNYRVGYQGFYDLRIYDQAPAGVKHTNISCDGCRQQGIMGMRWQCAQCLYYNLCHTCYMNDKHDVNHCFFRYVTSSSEQRVRVNKRAKSVQIEAKGIFPGARVVRGPDWDWGTQDGGPGKQGKVLDIRGWDSESGRSVANVQWDNGSTNVYRLGHKGKVDVKYVYEASGGLYYRDHLPKLGDGIEASTQVSVSFSFKVGDKVRVDLDVETLKVMQEGHGGWNPKMADCVGKNGVVHRITDRGDIRVQYEGMNNRWTIHPGALTKVSQFEVGDFVRIIDNAAVAARDSQHARLADCSDNMKAVLGKLGVVVQLYADGDLKVKVGDAMLRFNAKCCTLVPHGQQDINNTFIAGDGGRILDHPNRTLHAGLDDLLQAQQSTVDDPEKLVRGAAQGHVEICREIIRKHPNKVDMKSSGKTAIQVAAHQGHTDIVRMLLANGANLQVRDEDGDSALHYSAFGDQPDVMLLLLQAGADVNALNTSQCSALHIAINKQHVRCVSVLLQFNCDVNVQDSYGDSGLHDAMSKDNTELIDLLLNTPSIDLSLRNARGFNALHHAALKGHTYAAQKILTKARQLVDLQKDDGFSALHLAALNGHYNTAETLITTGQANIEIENNRKQTPLLLAISQGHAALIEVLVLKGACVNVADEEGDTCLHLALSRQTASILDNAPAILQIFSEIDETATINNAANLSIACFLLQHGASIDARNHRNISAAMHVTDMNAMDVLSRYIGGACGAVCESPFNGGDASSMTTECIWCSDAGADVLFRPCGHRIACVPCSVRIKKCIKCHTLITAKIGPGGAEISKHLLESMEAEQMRELRNKMEVLEESRICSICLENAWNVAFLCGHSACSKCAEALRQCHMCRKPILSKINLFT